MKILVIDNNTAYIDKLLDILTEHEVELATFEAIPKVSSETDLVVLSGSKYSVVYEGDFADELGLIRSSSVPIIGLCAGFELILTAFGGELHEMAERVHGTIMINDYGNDDLLANIADKRAFESHRWAAQTLPEELVALARSETGYEIIKHVTKPIYGLQFHPEMSPAGSLGRVVFERLVGRL